MGALEACRVSLWLGALSGLAILVAAMALQDIYHGEPDLTLEWAVLRLAFLVIVVFHGFALTAAWKALKVVSSRPTPRS